MIPRFFAPTVTVRLFDPMPLPKTLRLRRPGRSYMAKRPVVMLKPFNFKVSRIPSHS